MWPEGLLIAQIAAYVDADGTQHQYTAVCPHFGCIVQWNQVDQTFNCPCHGAGFTKEGKVIQGPATTDLTPLWKSSRAHTAPMQDAQNWQTCHRRSCCLDVSQLWPFSSRGYAGCLHSGSSDEDMPYGFIEASMYASKSDCDWVRYQCNMPNTVIMAMSLLCQYAMITICAAMDRVDYQVFKHPAIVCVRPCQLCRSLWASICKKIWWMTAEYNVRVPSTMLFILDAYVKSVRGGRDMSL